jgi:hypothetical protein
MPSSKEQPMTTKTQPTPTATNRYGQMARDHMRRWCPTRYAQILDPGQYFETLGNEILDEIENLEQQVLRDHPATTFDEKIGQANMARMMAEERVLAERVFLSPEMDSGEPATDETGAWTGPSSTDWIPLHHTELDEHSS